MDNTKNSKWFLIIGIAIPIIVIVFIAIFSYSPSKKVDPKYDFLYYFRDYTNSYCVKDGIYVVAKSQIKISDVVVPAGSECRYDLETDPPKIYRYDSARGGHFQISFDDAKKLKLDNNSVSPDGLHIQRGDNYNNAGVFEIFGGSNRDYNSIFLADTDRNVVEVDIGVSNYYDFVFIGWIIE